MPSSSKAGVPADSELSVDRRRFLSGGAAAGVSVAAAVASSAATAATAKEIVWDREVDIVVIGAGIPASPPPSPRATRALRCWWSSIISMSAASPS